MIHDCSQCGICCRLFLINLNEKEYRSGIYKTQLQKFGMIDDFPKAEACGANFLKQKSGGSCWYLKSNKCSIHNIRPQACRNFFCTSKAKRYRHMIEEIYKAQKNQAKHI